MARRFLPALGLVLLLPLVVSCGASTLTGNLPERQLFTEGLAYEALSNYSAALERYNVVLSDYGGSGSWSQRARLRSARIHKNHLNRPERAIEYYNAYLERHESNNQTKASVLMELARVYREIDQTDQSIETYRTVIRKYSSIAQVEESYYNLGELYLDENNYEKALNTFRKLIESFPDGDLKDGALFQLAKAYEGSDQPARQLETYQRLLNEHPDSDLHEYTVFLTVRLATDLNRKQVAFKWAKYYRDEYKDGQYRGRIDSILQRNGDGQPETE